MTTRPGAGTSGRNRRRFPRRPKPWSERNRRERGIALVWLAMTLLTMVLFAGFAVDVSNWYLQAERIQRAADAGAHAGVIFMPGDLATATSTAKSTVTKNGYTAGDAQNTAVSVTQEPNPNRIRVKITTDVPSFFIGLIGMDKIRMTREAVAEYIAPVPMGSPQNKLGNDPDGTDAGTQLWLNFAGPQTGKQQGERYGSKVCNSTSGTGGAEYGCTGLGGTSTEYSQDGYFFTVDVKSKGTGDLMIQAFDASFVNVGNTCTSNMPNASQINTLKADARYPDAATRYGSTVSGLSGAALAAAQKYCAGDQGWSGYNVETTFIVRSPDDTPWNNTDNPVVSTATCKPVKVSAYNPSSSTYIYDQLMSATSGNLNAAYPTLNFGQTFRRWATICTIPSGSVQLGQYIVQVRTNAKASSLTDYDPTVATEGHNRLSMRVGFGAAGVAAVDGSNVTLAARGQLPIYANSVGADTRFYLARILPNDAGRTLRISLYDMGESDKGGVLQVLPPAEVSASLPNFTGCDFTRDDNKAMTEDPSTCKVSNIYSTSANNYMWNGRLLIIDVPIPKTYTCNQAAATGCWIKIKMQYPTGAVVNDATTWSAAILGNPIRIVE